jgi:hypothetical protein
MQREERREGNTVDELFPPLIRVMTLSEPETGTSQATGMEGTSFRAYHFLQKPIVRDLFEESGVHIERILK